MKSFFRATYAFMKRLVGLFLDKNCSIHAAGLTYFALLAVVPVLCCILVAAKACHVDHYAKGEINRRIDVMIESIKTGQDDGVALLTPRSEEEREKKRIAAEQFALQARQISDTIFDRVDHFDVGTLGWIGFGFLLWTVISSLGTVETSFNQIFDVPRPRPIWKRAYMYLFIMIVLPILATLAMSMPLMNAAKQLIELTLGATWLTKWVGDGIIFVIELKVVGYLVTFLFSSMLFVFFFWVMPNCRVSFRPSLWGGMLTAVLFYGWLRLCAVAQVGIAKSSALYGSFAFLPIVLAWLYMSWQIILFGACLIRCLSAPGEGKAR